MYAKSIVIFLVIFLVDSNDSMYGSDPKFLNELKSMCSTLVEEVLSYLKTLAQSEVCLALINIFFKWAYISTESYYIKYFIYSYVVLLIYFLHCLKKWKVSCLWIFPNPSSLNDRFSTGTLFFFLNHVTLGIIYIFLHSCTKDRV